MSRTDRSKWNGAWLLKRSCSVGAKTDEHQSTKLVAFPCVSMTPFGVPVEPEV